MVQVLQMKIEEIVALKKVIKKRNKHEKNKHTKLKKTNTQNRKQKQQQVGLQYANSTVAPYWPRSQSHFDFALSFVSHPDITFVVDWVLRTNYLFIYLGFVYILYMYTLLSKLEFDR